MPARRWFNRLSLFMEPDSKTRRGTVIGALAKKLRRSLAGGRWRRVGLKQRVYVTSVRMQRRQCLSQTMKQSEEPHGRITCFCLLWPSALLESSAGNMGGGKLTDTSQWGKASRLGSLFLFFHKAAKTVDLLFAAAAAQLHRIGSQSCWPNGWIASSRSPSSLQRQSHWACYRK